MVTIYQVFSELQRILNEHFKKISADLDSDDEKGLIKGLEEDFSKNASIAIGFSTKNFPRPIRIGYIQKRIREILALFLKDRIILNDVLIAVEEAITNIVEHSYELHEDPIIDFQFILYTNKLIIKIDDFGEKGRKFQLESVNNYKSLDELRQNVSKTRGGMGVFLIRKIMDDVKYEARPGEYNRITMIKLF